jgi:hypothetical protein
MLPLLAVVSEIESDNNHLAARFEPTLFQSKELWVLKTVPLVLRGNPGISQDTALCFACTSYGLYQPLGANIYALGYSKTVFDFVQDTAAQDALFAKFIAPKGFTPLDDVSKWSQEQFTAFATLQNGPGDVANYIFKMKQIIAKGVAK